MMAVDSDRVGLSRGIHRMTSAERPAGAIPVADDEVLNIQWNLIKKWEPASQMWPFRVGPWLIGMITGVTGLLALNNIRKVLYLKEAARFSVLAGTIPVPAFLTVILNTTLVTEPIMLQTTECPVCLELRAATIQLATGFLHPVTLAVLSSVMAAHAKKTYSMPPWNQPLAIIHELRKIVRPMHGLLTILLSANLFTAFNIARYQMEKMPLVNEKLKTTGMLKMHVRE